MRARFHARKRALPDPPLRHQLGIAVAFSDCVIQVIVKLSTVPRQTAEVIGALRSLRLAIQAEHGLVSANIYVDAEATDSLFYIEEWRAPECFAQDVLLAHYQRIFALMERSPKAPVLRVSTIGDPGGIEHLGALLRSHTDRS